MQIRDLKSKQLKEENTESNQSVEEKIVVHEVDNKNAFDDQESNKPASGSDEPAQIPLGYTFYTWLLK